MPHPASPALDFNLGETADAIRETTARFAADRIAPLAARIDAANSFPRELWPQMGELGLHGITVEEHCDAGQTTRFDVAGTILMASESAAKVSLEAIQALGGGYTKDHPVERCVRDAKVYVLVQGDDAEIDQVLDRLKHASTFVRQQVAMNLELRHVPHLHFVRDTAEENAARVGELLSEIEISPENETENETEGEGN